MSDATTSTQTPEPPVIYRSPIDHKSVPMRNTRMVEWGRPYAMHPHPMPDTFYMDSEAWRERLGIPSPSQPLPTEAFNAIVHVHREAAERERENYSGW